MKKITRIENGKRVDIILVKNYREQQKVCKIIASLGENPLVGNPCEGPACTYCKNNCTEYNGNCFLWKEEHEPEHKAGTCTDFSPMYIEID